MRTWKYWDEQILKDSLDALDPSIVVVAYGTNEASSEDYSMKQYRKDLRRSLQILKDARPDQICILAGPSDRGRKKGRKSFAVWERTIMVADIQREIAPEFGCVFWDWQQAQGGEGSMIAWRYTNPPLAAKDLIHHTRPGYIHMANQFIEALDDAALHYQ